MRIPPPNPGVYEGVPGDVYRSWDAVNMGTLSSMADSPLACWHARESEKPSTPAMQVGAVLHAAMLEPSRIETDFVGAPINEKTGKPYGRGTEKWAAFEAEHPGKIVCSDDDREAVRAMLEKFRRNKWACGAIFDPARKTEVSVVWRDDLTGLPCKCRPDVVLPEALPDLKTTGESVLSNRWLRRHARTYGWFHRSVWYSRGWRMAKGADLPVWFILAQSVPPFEIVVCRVSDESKAGAARQIDGWMTEYAKCLAANDWPGIAPEPITINDDWLDSFGGSGIDDYE